MALHHRTSFFLAPRPVLCILRRPRLLRLQKIAVSPVASRDREGGQLKLEAPRPSLLSSFGLNGGNKQEVQELAQRTVEQAAQNDVIEELELAQKAVLPAPDLRPFLQTVGVMEARYIRMLSNLCSQTYLMAKLTPRSLYRRHRLTLVTTSLACDASLREVRRSAQDVLSEADAMAADPRLVQALSSASRPPPPPPEAETEQPQGAASPMALLPPAGTEPAAAAAPASPADLVANSLSAAAVAAAAAASSVYTAAASAAAATAASAAAPLANNIQAFSRAATSTLPPVRSLAAQLQSAATVGHSTAVATVAAVSAALDSAWNKDRRLPKECQSPTEWFVCDDEATHTRYFVVQGSDNLDHWRVNLTFDPVVFEDEAVGVKVHRGVYEAAQALYDRFLPLVQDHLASSPFARFAFTGHSLGGSLGTLLMLMFVRRGVLPRTCLAPTYTFGSPAILCEGGDGKHGLAGGGILARLGLPDCAVRNVMMHKDIVPRAFACDYSFVADLLRRVSGSFRDHACLRGERQAMFNFVGQMMVLQPNAELTFVGGEGYHPMLPPGPGLFLVRQPSMLRVVQCDMARVAAAVQSCADAITAGAPAGSSVDGGERQADGSCVIGSRAGPGLGPVPHSARDALFQLMNNPHPLETLRNSAAYGPAGQISRFHNPDNYCRALGGVLRSRGTSWQRLMRHASQSGLRWHVSALEQRPGVQVAASRRQGGGKLHGVQRGLRGELAEAAARLEGC